MVDAAVLTIGQKRQSGRIWRADRGNSPTKLKVTCRIAKTISDEIESVVEDLRQRKLL